MIDKKKIIKKSLNWRCFFNQKEVEDAIIMQNNDELLRKVRACQAELDTEYQRCATILDGNDEAAKKELISTFKKPEIDTSTL